MRSRTFVGASLACAALLSGSAAGAQESRSVGNIALNQFDPAPAGDVFSAIATPFTGGHLQPRARVFFDHAVRPLVLSTDVATGDVVSRQTLVHIDAAIALWDRLLIDVAAPIVLAQGGDDPKVNGMPISSPSSASLGDMRLGVRLRPFGSDGAPIQIAVAANAYAPTGGDGNFAGDGGFRLAPVVILGGRINKVVWSIDGGASFRSSDNPSTVNYGLGFGVLLLEDFLQVGAEVYGATPLSGGLLTVSDNSSVERSGTTNLELMLSARFRLFWGLSVNAAAGPGLTDAVGTPSFRAVAGLGWTMPPKASGVEGAAAPADTDKDGILDAVDACPHAHGVMSDDPKRRGCPVVDRDEDGVPDVDDACPDKQGDKSVDKAKNGCPTDADGDGISDDVDACPQEKGVASTDVAKNGCVEAPPPPPPDADGDGLIDSADACPQEKGEKSAEGADASSSGCPKNVRVKGSEIALLQPVVFRTVKGKESIDPASEPVLKDVADVIAQHPEFLKIEVQGYTDNVGTAKTNEKASGARAELCRAWLVEHGVQADRVVSKGYGPASPIADNRTAEGRKANRRVQILVLEVKKP